MAAFGEEMKFGGQVLLFVFQVEQGGCDGVLAVVGNQSDKERNSICRSLTGLLKSDEWFILIR